MDRLPALGLILLGVLSAPGLVTSGISASNKAIWVVGVVLIFFVALAATGLTQAVAGEARVVQFFGRYTGTVRSAGLRWVNPYAVRRRVSTRIRNHETAVAKVNDADGNPIEIPPWSCDRSRTRHERCRQSRTSWHS